MRGIRSLAILFVSFVICTAMGSASIHAADLSEEQQTQSASLRGTVTDPSGALVPGALVQLRGASAQQVVRTDGNGKYVFPSLPPGAYTVRFLAKGFQVHEATLASLTGATVLDAQLQIQAEDQVVNVEDNAHTVSIDPTSNGGALVLGEKELPGAVRRSRRACSSSCRPWPDRAPAPTAARSTSTDSPAAILPAEILHPRNPHQLQPVFHRSTTGPASAASRSSPSPAPTRFHGQAFFQFNNQYLNSRSPLLTQSTRPPYDRSSSARTSAARSRSTRPRSASISSAATINENAFIYATTLDSNLNPQTVNQAIVTPQTRTSFTPRLDYTINDKQHADPALSGHAHRDATKKAWAASPSPRRPTTRVDHEQPFSSPKPRC